MGLFDQIRIKQVMPDGYQSDDWYQTKSMECSMTDYEVDENGQLWELSSYGNGYAENKKLSCTVGIHLYDGKRYYDALFDLGKLLVIRVHPPLTIM